jgi:UDP-N-acetylmuramate dehydrogenase
MTQPATTALHDADALSALARDLDPAHLRRAEPLAPYTTFKIGGPADLLYDATSADALATAISAARAHGVPWFVLGLGANILVGDGGVRGLVIRNVARAHAIAPDGRLRAESGAIMRDLVLDSVAQGWSGLEHYVGIPSTVGGALWQNLHFLSPPPARERTMFIEEVVAGAELLTEAGERVQVGHDYFDFGYDYSTLHVRPDVVLSATFQLAPGDPAHMRAIIAENLAWRADRHPPLDTQPSAGSVFKKIDGVGAGRLADWSGMKGVRIGGAMVTERHANILINTGGATARDVRLLIGHIQSEVERQQGYRLSPEIGFVGDFGDLGPLPAPGWENQDGFTDGVPPGGHPEAHRDAERR